MMMFKRRPTRQELYERILEIDATRKASGKRIEKALEDLYAMYFARVKAMVLDPKALKTGERVTLESTIAQMRQLDVILAQSGFDDVVDRYAGEFEALTKSSLDYYKAFGAEPSLAGISPQTLDAYVRYSEGEFRKLIPAKIVAPIQNALLQVNFGTTERSAVYEQIQALEPTLTPSQVVVTVDDQFAMFQRAVLAETASATGLDIHVYIGPDDKVTSPQCQEMLHVNFHGVAGMLYKDEITVGLHPALTRNPLIGGGHPRCRHHWSPVTDSYAEALGFRLRQKAA